MGFGGLASASGITAATRESLAMSIGKALFIDSTGDVWVTDGSKSGTSELIPRPSEIIGGFQPFGDKLLFLESEFGITGAHIEVYTTDGAKAGTKEFSLPPSPSFDFDSYLEDHDYAAFGNELLILDNVTAVQGEPPKVEFLVTNLTQAGTKTFTIAGPPLPLDFNASDFTGFGNLVLFSATDYKGVNTLWTSNGTAAGTKPLSIKGASTSFGGLRAGDLTVFGNEVLFEGIDNDGDSSLWKTNGTSAGTHELMRGVFPGDITVVKSEAFFSDGSGPLWVTNGTAAGTKEIVVSGAGDQGLAPFPKEITPFGNKVVFAGDAATGGLRPFISDGTPRGSFELSSIAEVVEGFTILGHQALFAAEDAADKFGLWVTNGTLNGTFELTKIHNAYFLGVSPTQLTVVGNEVLFVGEDSLENVGLWVTNGTTAGTREIYSPLSITDLTAAPSAKATELLAAAGDILIAGHHSTLTATAGADLFEFATPGSPLHPDSNMIVHFDAIGDKIAFSDPGFHLGLASPSATPQALPWTASPRTRPAGSPLRPSALPTTRAPASSITTRMVTSPAARANSSPPSAGTRTSPPAMFSSSHNPKSSGKWRRASGRRWPVLTPSAGRRRASSSTSRVAGGEIMVAQ
jgi:hypothetical protein